jgi:allantoinase
VFDLVLKGGVLVRDGAIDRVDVGVKDGRVAATEANLPPGRATYDASGKWILPGGVDTHVHFREPGREDKEDFETGSRAALGGGVTTVLDIQNNEPFTTGLAEAEAKHDLVSKKTLVRYGIYGSVGAQNLARLKATAPAVVGFKAFMTQSTGSLTVSGLGDLADAFRAVRETGRVFAVHSESDAIHLAARSGLPDSFASHVLARPRIAEAVAVAECLELLREYGGRLHLPHLSTARAVALVRRAKEEGLSLSAATCPHYLVFCDEDVAKVGGALKVNPSIKGAEDRAALLAAVRDGVIDHVHSDHAPHTPEEKGRNYLGTSSGIAGVQHETLVLVDLAIRGALAPFDVARLLSEAPARAFGLKDVGSAKVGAFADLTVVDPKGETVVRSEDLLSKAATSPYVGRTFKGRIDDVFLGGAHVVRASKVVAATPPPGARVRLVDSN